MWPFDPKITGLPTTHKPTGAYIIACNQGTDNVAVFKVDQATGKLTQVGDLINVPASVCVKFLAVE